MPSTSRVPASTLAPALTALAWSVLAWAVLVSAVLASAVIGVSHPVELLDGEVRYRARDQVSVWIGVAPLAAFSLEIDPADLGRTRLRAVVHPGDFTSGVGFRDFTARRSVFDTERYPDAVFELGELEGPSLDLPDGATRRFRALGTLELRGVTGPVTAEVVVTRDGDVIDATASFEVSLEAYGLPPPRFLTLVAEDRVDVEVDVRAHLLPATTTPTPR